MWKTNASSCERRLLILAIALLACVGGVRSAQAAEHETWVGTWNAPNLWRSVELSLAEHTGSAVFRIGSATEKVEAVTEIFAIQDTVLTAELEYAGTRVLLEGRIGDGKAGGGLRILRGEMILTEGSWSLERRYPSDLSAQQVLSRVREALNFPGSLAGGFTVDEAPMEGGDISGDAPWSATVDSNGRLSVREHGEPVLVFDGQSVLSNSAPFGWRHPDARMQEKLLFGEVLRSGAWLVDEGPFRFAAARIGVGSEERYVIDMTAPLGVVPGRVVIDPRTWLPEMAMTSWDAGDRSFGFSGYSDHAGCLFPENIILGYRGREQEWRTTRVASGGPTPEPISDSGVRHDPSASPVLKGVHGAGENGHLFVRPIVGGKEIGWFHVDTGAPFMILDAQAADSLDLEIIRDMGSRSIRLLPEIQVGQLILEDRLVLVTDLSGSSAPEGTHRKGVVGGPVFEQAVVIYDYRGKELSVFAPESFSEEVAGWQPMTVESVPVTAASFEGISARFYVDTGKSATVSFFSHPGAMGGWFDGHPFQESENETVEGTTIELMTHLESFTFGGVVFPKPKVFVKLPGTTNDDVGRVAGFIGRGFFRDRRIVFDYARGRLGFAESRR